MKHCTAWVKTRIDTQRNIKRGMNMARKIYAEQIQIKDEMVYTRRINFIHYLILKIIGKSNIKIFQAKNDKTEETQ